MYKKLLSTFFIALSLMIVSPVAASEQKQVTIVNPIRGEDFWSYSYPLLETPKKQYELINSKNIEATWMPRYDALKNTEVQSFLKSLNQKQEVGLFLEVTPTLTTDAGVTYNQSPNWHYSKSVLVIGYSPLDRIKLIDTAMNQFKQVFGYFPKSVGAWWIDAYSLQYMKDKYQIEMNMDVADQFSTDGYQVWGQYWSSPFYPSKKNALMPASSVNEKIGVITVQWAGRDPFNGYGNSVFESTYSVQANDYLLHDLGIEYFKQLIVPYSQVVVGLENDFDWNQFGAEYTRQINHISGLGNTQVLTMENFGRNYRKAYPKISPKVTIVAGDPLGSDGKVVWYQTERYRVGLFVNNTGVIVRDLRQFNDGVEEACYFKACEALKLGFSADQAIDEVNFGTRWVLDEGSVTDFKTENTTEGLKISYRNGAGLNRTITFLSNDIRVDEEIKTIATAILHSVETSQKINQEVSKDEADFVSYVQWAVVLPKLFWDGFKFAIFVVLFLVLPGFIFSRRLLLSVPLGLAFFSLLSWVLAWMKIDLILWVIPVAALVLGIYFRIRPNKIVIDKIDLLSGLLVVVGSISWLLTQVKNGLLFNYGFGYWGPNGHDAIWHLQLISALTQNVPPDNFIYAGEKLLNYHYFYDLVLAQINKLLGIEVQNLLFRFFPLLLSIGIGLLAYNLVILLANRLNYPRYQAKVAGLLGLFFIYFGGSWGWLVSFIRNGSFGGETTFWAQQSISTLLNPPFASSLLLLLAGFYIYYSADFNQKVDLLKKGLLLVLLWGVLIEFKVYAGVLVLLALGIISLYKLFQGKWRFLLMSSSVAILSLIVFLPNNSSSSSLISFSPFWLIRTMLEFEDRLFWPRLLLTMQSGVWYKEWAAIGLAIIIFLVGNLGWRIFSLSYLTPYRKFGLLGLFSALGLVLPMLFLQAGTNWNIIQFFYYSLMIQALFTGLILAKWLMKLPRVGKFVVVGLIFLLTIPTSLNTLSQYLPKRPPAKLGNEEIAALQNLATRSQGVVLSPIYDERVNARFAAPKPLFAYASTSYVSAFSHQPSFLADSINLEILNIDSLPRVNVTREILKGNNNSALLLRNNNIKYIYLPKQMNINIDEGKLGVEKVYDNQGATLYQVKP